MHDIHGPGNGEALVFYLDDCGARMTYCQSQAGLCGSGRPRSFRIARQISIARLEIALPDKLRRNLYAVVSSY